ncbi:MAG: 5'-nucleotidase C-terminal domain-containing protein [Bacilli bacterium]|nr:5'-nucleotidase C-terminal domain-containing protein [Bacilli bacterium]
MKKQKSILVFLTALLLSACSPELSSYSWDSALEREPMYIDFYGINDFHGAVLPSTSWQPGIESIGGFLKEAKAEGAVLINSGDMYQGSIESNYNRGELLSKCMKNIGFDSFTLGNHEFDWGDEAIKANAKTAGMDFLGANIYHYDMEKGQVLDFADDLVAKYTIVERGEWKIGIIGTIGKDQITSICSQFIDGYTFLDPIPLIMELSDELRTEQNCDVVVLSHHGEQDELRFTGLTNVSPVSNMRYIDAAFCAHSHQNETAIENGVRFVQSDDLGETMSKITLFVREGVVETARFTTDVVAKGYSDAELSALINEYKTVSDAAGNEVLCQADSNYYDRYEASSNLIVKAIGEYEKQQGIAIDYAIANGARSALRASNNEITYSNLYTSVPFDNSIVLCKVKGTDLIHEFAFCDGYRPENITLSADRYYTCAIIDYLATHRGSDRKYDYYPSIEVLEVQTEKNYRDICADYLRNLSKAGKKFVGAEYASSLDCFNTNAF